MTASKTRQIILVKVRSRGLGSTWGHSNLVLQLQRHSSPESWRVFTYDLCSHFTEKKHHCLLSESLRGPQC